jgi:hypothetical protein
VSPRAARSRSGGLTLVELVLAIGLLSILMVAIFNLLDGFLSLWERSETRRQLVEESSGVLELIAADLASLEGGPRGDLLAEWVSFDTDGDGLREKAWPRLRLVRHASPAEIARLQAGAAEKDPGEGLLEVVWAVLPARRSASEPDLRAEGILWRGEQLFRGTRDKDEAPSFFDERFTSASGQLPPGAVNEVTHGVLWLGVRFAGQTTILGDIRAPADGKSGEGGWALGHALTDSSASWDAWSRGRPDAERHHWNQPPAGMPAPRGRPVLPRRVRLELELERERDLKRRTRLERVLNATDSAIEVGDGTRLPPKGGHVLIDAEWMEVVSISGNRAVVRRAARGTRAAIHEAGAVAHYGQSLLREVPIAMQQEDWHL